MIADPWQAAKEIMGNDRLILGPQASHHFINDPSHFCMTLARYRAASALIGDARRVLEVGCGEGIGAGILARGRELYLGIDTDSEALRVAIDGAVYPRCFMQADALTFHQDGTGSGFGLFNAVVSLDVAEHIPAEHEDRLLTSLTDALYKPLGICVIGTPNAAFDHLASPQSKAGHCNLYSAARLRDLMKKYFRVVQEFGMNDVALHFGHPDARHYLLAVGIGPR